MYSCMPAVAGPRQRRTLQLCMPNSHSTLTAGEKYMTNEEADAKGSGPVKPVTATTDLYDAIEAGEMVPKTSSPAGQALTLHLPTFGTPHDLAQFMCCRGLPEMGLVHPDHGPGDRGHPGL